MEYKTHIVTSMTFAVPMLSVTDELTMINLGAVVLGSLFPDIDHPRSYVGQKAKIVSRVTNKTFGHRGATHSLLALAIIYIMGNVFVQTYLAASLAYVPFWFAWGYLLHLLEDGFSRDGIRFFWPLQKKPWHLGGKFLRYKTSSLSEHIFFGFVVCLLLVEVKMLWQGQLESLFSGEFLSRLQTWLLELQNKLT